MANSRICSVPACDKPHYSKGYCSSHYQRFCRYGDPLGGVTSPGEPLRFINEVALHHAGGECLIWPFGKNRDGYGNFWVDGKHVGAHRYICELVHGAPPTPKHEAAHSCGRGHEACISPIHLDWKTRTNNQADRLEHGTHNRGELSGKAKLTEADVREILALKGIEKQRDLAKRFGVSSGAIAGIHHGRRWAWLSEDAKEIAA